ncbi:MAG TPA: CcoQ/FixQ family Cbb3-type cytochrome c oxidase assembly chaperone [Bacteroidia bacterium]|jgi:hypothetical protein|nr:CcoQ/FixQ family Cbb3-type cytochrome c oxidase assembly chaperone [Bacteroidia bacterium]
MKFINYLTSISGVDIYPLISLLVFFLFFVVLTIYILRTDKERMKELAAIPVDEPVKKDKKSNDQK